MTTPADEPTATDLMAAMRQASGRELTELGRQLADRLDREKALRDNEVSQLRRNAESLNRAIAGLAAAASSAELLQRACDALANICSASCVLVSGIDIRSDTAALLAIHRPDAESPPPQAFSLEAGSAESRAVDSGVPVTASPVDTLGELFPHICTIVAVAVDNSPAVLIHIAGELDSAQHDSAALLTQVLGACLQRLGLATRRTRQLDLLRSSGITHDKLPRATDAAEPAPAAAPWTEPLTERESEVLRLVLKGASNTAIADELVITVDTVKSHVKRILRKLGATNRSELIARHSACGVTNRSTAPPSR
ncbi:helix-turn-helix transcriptional regulator [Nocardia jiangxiensis]|uniref:Response regulator transcription factor n=1 Tax=Nocardia jiangxiensis TaxID=282685 RepID=A0ABW6S8Q7_9NOCA|nr:helix-turn-helix transcriptional regulator [Nocardia jiangxiensis]